jgi:hypothetical protein
MSGKGEIYDYDRCCLDEWRAVPHFDWTLGHGVGLVAEE